MGIPDDENIAPLIQQYGPEDRWGDPAIQNVERWLSSKGCSAGIAQSAPEDIWVFQAYKTNEIAGRPLPIGLGAKQLENGHELMLHLPLAANTSADQRKQLEQAFEKYVEDLEESRSRIHVYDSPRGKVQMLFNGPATDLPSDYTEVSVVYPTLKLEFIPVSNLEELDSLTQRKCQEQQLEYLGTAHYNLEAELRTDTADEEGLQRWLDTPHPHYSLQTPREILGTKADDAIRDDIMRRRHGGVS